MGGTEGNNKTFGNKYTTEKLSMTNENKLKLNSLKTSMNKSITEKSLILKKRFLKSMHITLE